jgi:hypothetical protein
MSDPIFKHRFDSAKAGDVGDVIDAIHLMTDRALGQLYLLINHFEGESRMNDQLVQAVISSTIQEIEDIDSVLLHHWESVRPNRS